jgi:hypothetical protein
VPFFLGAADFVFAFGRSYKTGVTSAGRQSSPLVEIKFLPVADLCPPFKAYPTAGAAAVAFGPPHLR